MKYGEISDESPMTSATRRCGDWLNSTPDWDQSWAVWSVFVLSERLIQKVKMTQCLLIQFFFYKQLLYLLRRQQRIAYFTCPMWCIIAYIQYSLCYIFCRLRPYVHSSVQLLWQLYVDYLLSSQSNGTHVIFAAQLSPARLHSAALAWLRVCHVRVSCVETAIVAMECE